MSNALTIYEKVQDPIEFSRSHATALASLLGCNEPQGQAAALTCLCEGLTPIDFVRRYHLIQGKPTMRADAMLAEFRMNYGGDYEIVERSPTRAAIKLSQGEKSFEAEFTWKEAQESRWPWTNWKDKSKGLKDNWGTSTDQRNMLWARLISDSMRAFCPELVAGVYTPEEIGDVVEGAVVSVQSTPMTASQFRQQEAEQKADEPVAAGEVVEATVVANDPEPEPHENDRLISAIRDLFERLFGDRSHEATEQALKSRNANSLRNLSVEQLTELHDKLVDKEKAAGN